MTIFPPVREICFSLKLMNYLLLQVDKQCIYGIYGIYIMVYTTVKLLHKRQKIENSEKQCSGSHFEVSVVEIAL